MAASSLTVCASTQYAFAPARVIARVAVSHLTEDEDRTPADDEVSEWRERMSAWSHQNEKGKSDATQEPALDEAAMTSKSTDTQ